MINQMYSRLELRFWDWAIPVLSHSRHVKNFFRQFHPLTRPAALKNAAIQSIFVALAGFAGGLLVSLLIR